MPKQSMQLSGQWEFKPCSLDEEQAHYLNKNGWLRATVPGSVFSNLIEAGQINETDVDINPENTQWVSEKAWVYKKIFDVPKELLNCERHELVFDGLDTIASVWLNGECIGQTNNMFIPFRFDVTERLKAKGNTLSVQFTPASQYAKKFIKKYGKSKFLKAERIYLRKSQYQFGWDWCPAMVGCGIWRPVRIEGIQTAQIDDVHIQTVRCDENHADVRVTVSLDKAAQKALACNLCLSNKESIIERQLTFDAGKSAMSLSIKVDKPKLWWPVGYGDQNLYRLDVTLTGNNEVIDQRQDDFGIRIIKLNRRQDDYGQEFQFEVNGQPVYVRGANWVPASMLPGSVTSQDYKKFLNAAVEANMNMIRVWGGGYYEAKEFYQLCDQLGLMVWQDFMFACGYYPDGQWFQKQIETEVRVIIKQLRNHPSLSLWCGNNEIDWIHSKKWFGNSRKFYGEAIYHNLLPRRVAELDPDHDYIPSTPVASEQTQDINDPGSGAVHQWNVWNFNAPARDYITPAGKVPRFVTEFGMQSLPNMETVKSFCAENELRIGSRGLDKHEYQENNSRIYRYIGDVFGAVEDIEQFVYLSQLTQSRAVKAFVEHLRAHNYRNSGALFWQLNDACAAISWAAIDHKYRPKALYYYAKRFYSNLLVTAVPDSKNLAPGSREDLKPKAAIVINDSNRQITASLNCRLIDLFGNLIEQAVFPVTIEPFSDSRFLELPEEIATANNMEKRVLHLVLEENGKPIAENVLLFVPDKYINWPVPHIDSKLIPSDNGTSKLVLKADTVVKDLHISIDGKAELSDNFIDLLPDREYEINIKIASKESLKQDSLKFNFVKSGR